MSQSSIRLLLRRACDCPTQPTSGLDSEASLQVIQVLSDFAKDRRKTVICTIHQPSSSVFNKFDKL